MDQETLSNWYRLDTNIIPSMYVLQPISSVLIKQDVVYEAKAYSELLDAAMSKWWDIQARLQRIFRAAAYKLRRQERFNEEEEDNYYISVTEREVLHGIINADNPNHHCLCFMRELTDIHLENVDAVKKYVDIITGKPEKEAQRLLERLKSEKVKKVLSEDNIFQYQIPWSDPDGMDAKVHKDYLQEFSEIFTSKLINLIQLGVDKMHGMTKNDLFVEIAQHLNLGQKYNRIFHGREDILSEIAKYLDDPGNVRPLILHGEPGSGKSSLIARATINIVYGRRKSSCYQQLNLNKSSVPSFQPVLILRFIGTTPRSSKTLSLFQDICEQLYFLFKPVLTAYSEQGDEIFRNTIEKLENRKLIDEPGQIVQYFLKLIKYISLSVTYFRKRNSDLKIDSGQIDDHKPLIYLFLDSIDQLRDNDNDDVIQRLIYLLPSRVKLVLSVLPSAVLDQVPNRIPVTNLDHQLAITIVEEWLKRTSKRLSEPQWAVVSDAFGRCSLPLFVKIVQDEIVSWSSFALMKQTTLCDTIQQSIHKLFQRIEVTHGRVLVERALSYITASRTGLSESELEDILSIDEVVLNDVYQYHLPPVRRIPPLLWTRIRADLSDYVTERESDGSHVVYWYHQQFIDIVMERYFTNNKYSAAIHSNLADFFSGRWAGVLKPFMYEEIHRVRFGLATLNSKSDRLVSMQPLIWFDDVKEEVTTKVDNKGIKRRSKKIPATKHSINLPVKRKASLTKGNSGIRYNYRRLNELPYHLLKSKRKEELFETCLFDFQFLHSKISALPLHVSLLDLNSVISDIGNIQDIDSIQCQILLDCLRLSANNITMKPNNLGPQIIGRLFPYIEEMFWIRLLVNQIQFSRVCLDKCALVPLYSYLHTPGGALDFSFDGLHPFPPYAIAIWQSKNYLVSASTKIYVHNLNSGELISNTGIKDIKPGTVIKTMRFTHQESRILFGATNGGQIVKYDIDSTDVYLWHSKDLIAEPAIVAGVAVTSTNVIVWFSDEDSKKHYIYKYDIDTMKVIQRIDSLISEEFSLNYQIIDIEYISRDGEFVIIARPQQCLDDRYFEIFIISNYGLGLTQKGRCGYYYNNVNMSFTIILSTDGETIKVFRYFTQDNRTTYQLQHTKDPVLGINVSSGDEIVIVTMSFGFKLWNLKSGDKKGTTLTLPQSVVNVCNKNQFSSSLQFFRDFQYLLATVKQFLILYKLTDKSEKIVPFKVITAHYGRILNLQSISTKSWEKFITSSMDKTIKVWNIGNVLVRDVKVVHKMERPIEGVCTPSKLNTRSPFVVTYTRSSASLWNLESGEIRESFPTSPNSLLVNCHLITDNAFLKVIVVETKLSTMYVMENEVKNVLRYDCVEETENIESFYVSGTNVLILCNKTAPECLVTCNIYNVSLELPLLATFTYFSSLKFVNLCPPIISCNKRFIYFLDIKPMDISKSLGQYSLEQFKVMKKIKIKKSINSEIELGNFEILSIDSGTDNQIAMINSCSDYGYMFDFKATKCLKKIVNWSGPNVCLEIEDPKQTISVGLFSPTRGGLEIINMKTKKVYQTLIPRVSEGLCKSYGMVTESKKYVIYYRESKLSILVFRILDGRRLAEVNIQSEIRTIATISSSGYPRQNISQTNYRSASNDLIFIGCHDGTLVTMAIMDPCNCSD